ncbi:presequence protease chloroplastic mitochondrial-like [Chlorella sorokiniana]|uniref:Presequence protease chloroplastic mitochondrial-like n=1 Tax=Chlorella sorokiniana TaxID=3076 RepID=A0A2P6THA6_CHLSO|nr:presequence protease chloroplastic mitochondrial-like [Chlorella sorokiniana]|eukprot:PRW33675.1 presequence protease chloroplastic mitochondrial-like [Chlorella sorokiniana]
MQQLLAELLKGSLATYINALTYPDRTDLRNLLDVYMGNLSMSGVVLSEMEGVFSSPDKLNGILIQQELFRDNAYRFVSGGDPQDIPNLTFDALLEPVHATHYYPSGAGSQGAAASDVSSPAGGTSGAVPAGTGGGPPKAYCTLSWVLAEDHLDFPTELAGFFLDYMLIGTTAAPLYKTLIDSGLGEAVIGGGLDVDLRQPTYSVGLKGVEPGRCPEVFDLILTRLDELRSGGFNASTIEAATNSIEFQLRENNTGGFPRGLNQFLRALRSWLYGRDPLEPLQWEGPLEELKAALAEGEDVFGPLIASWMLDNTHRVALELLPDSGLAAERAAEEAARLQEAAEALGDDGLAAVAQAAAELQAWQAAPSSPAALATVPTLRVADLDPQTIVIPTAAAPLLEGSATRLDHTLDTNGILYLDLALDIGGLPPHLLPLVPLFCTCLTQMGTQRRSFVDLTEYLDQTTGGVTSFPLVSAHQGLEGDPRAYIMVRGKAVAAKAQDLLGVAAELLLEPRLDNKGRFVQLVLQEKAGLEQNLVEQGNSFASTRLAAQSTVAGWASEVMGGISYLQYIRGLASQVQDTWPQVLAQLEAIRAYAIHHAGALINLTGEDNLLADVAPAAARFVAGLPSGPRPSEPWNQTLPPESEAFLIPTQVSYTCKAADLYQAAGLPYNFNGTGSLIVATHYLATTWLWDSIRVQGGAYGAFFDYDLTSGQLTYCSYRDPGLLSTLDDFDKSAQFLAEQAASQDTLTKSIVGTVGEIDAYMLPDAKGYTALFRHLIGVSDEERQARRDRVLATTADDLKQLADLLQIAAEEGRVASVTSKSAAAAAQAQQPGLFDRVEAVM